MGLDRTSATLQVYLFGSLRINVAQQSVPLVASSTAALLGYLALNAPARQGLTRSRLAGTLFPDQTETQARRSLSQALYRLRRLLGEHADAILHADGELITLDSVWTDVAEFRTRAASLDVTDWRGAIELYAGDLLEDLDAEWILGPRTNLHELYLATLERACTTYTKAGELSIALSVAHRWTLADPLREEAHRAAMQLYARLGRYAAAMQQFNHLVQLLRDELQIEPLPETRALADAIRVELKEHAQPVEQQVFVGRRQERALLLEKVEQAQAGRGGLVLLEGEPDVGKTHLLEHITGGSIWRGLDVAWGRANQFSGTAPYAPLVDALQSALTGPRADQVRARVSGSTTQTLAWLFSHTRRHPPLSSVTASPSIGETEPQPDLMAALIECVCAIGNLNAHVFVLDDVHWASTGFWEIVPQLIEKTMDSPLLWILGYRTDELRSNSIAWEAVRTLDRKVVPTKIILTGLTPQDGSELARELGHVLDDKTARQLVERTGSNPLFLREALTQPTAGNVSFFSLLEQRLTRVPP